MRMIDRKTVKTRIVRKIILYILQMLRLLLHFRLRKLGHELRKGWLSITGRGRLAGQLLPPDNLSLIRSMLTLTEELHEAIGNTLLTELLKHLIYRADRSLKVLQETFRSQAAFHIPVTWQQRYMPDKSHETFVKIGKSSPGPSPPCQ